MCTSVTVAPSPRVVVCDAGFWSAWTARTREIASCIASMTSSSSVPTARSSSSAGTRTDAGVTPSNFSPYSRAASAPRSRTASTMGATVGSTALTSVPPRGRARRSSLVDGVRPRRSMTLSIVKVLLGRHCIALL